MPNRQIDYVEVDNYLIANPVDRTQHNCYKEAADKFGVDNEYIRSRYKLLRKRGKIVEGVLVEAVAEVVAKKLGKGFYDFKEKENGDAEVDMITDKRIRTKEDAIRVAKVDLKAWKVSSYETTQWEVGRKNKKTNLSWQAGILTGTVDDKGNFVTETLYRVKLKLSPRLLDKDLGLQKEAVIEAIKAYSPIVKARHNYENTDRDLLLEICTFDLHLGSLSWGEESGDSYDIKIAEERFKDAVRELLTKVNLAKVKRILFPIGNDMMNVDNKNNTTTNGTVVDTDVRFMKMLKVAKRLMIETIDELSLIAPVDVVVVPGNHDATVSLVLGEILDCWYHNNKNVNVYGSPRTRKYYQWGRVGIQLTHGDEENHKDLGLIFATEQKEMWAATDYRFCQVGHFHKNKKISYISVDEYQGFQVQVLPTLSSATAWAHKKGYHSLKQAKAFLFDENKGLVGEFTATAMAA
jgi:hypothetical protein